MSVPRRRILRDASPVLALTLSGLWCVAPIALADGPPRAPAARTAPAGGTLTIAVVTSPADPASRALFQSLRSAPWAAAQARSLRLVEVAADPAGGLGSPAIAEVRVYRQGPRGPELIGGRSGFAGANDVVQWLRTLAPAPAGEAPGVDSGLIQARFDHGEPAASDQGYAAPQPQYQPPQPQYQQPASVPASVPTPSMAPQSATTYAVPMAPASVVQAPPQNVLIQQPPAQIYFAATAAPAFMPQATSMPASVPAGNIFMPSGPAMAPASLPASAPPMLMAPASAPSMMMAPAAAAPMLMAPAAAAPVAMAPAATMAVAAAGPAVAGAALTTSSFSVPASSTTSRVRVRGPGPLASAAARFGERLTTLGRTRIETVQETRLETQVAQTPPGQFMTLSSTAASPLMPPQPTTCAPQQPGCQQPTCPQPATYPQPSPQGEPERPSHHFFSKGR